MRRQKQHCSLRGTLLFFPDSRQRTSGRASKTAPTERSRLEWKSLLASAICLLDRGPIRDRAYRLSPPINSYNFRVTFEDQLHPSPLVLACVGVRDRGRTEALGATL